METVTAMRQKGKVSSNPQVQGLKNKFAPVLYHFKELISLFSSSGPAT